MPSRKNGEIAWRGHKVLWRVSGGRVGTRATGMPVLELITTGRKSGVSRSVLLTYLTQDASYVVIATNAGDPRLPAWWLNLQADPAAEVVAGRKQHRVLAREAEGDERAALWERAVEMSSGYATYAEGLERRIPVVVLDPAG